jgi:excisionase family DNA binding protein
MPGETRVAMLVVDDGRRTDLTPLQFAEEFQLHPQTVYIWIKERRIRAYRVGRLIRIPRGEVMRVREEGIPGPVK